MKVRYILDELEFKEASENIKAAKDELRKMAKGRSKKDAEIAAKIYDLLDDIDLILSN